MHTPLRKHAPSPSPSPSPSLSLSLSLSLSPFNFSLSKASALSSICCCPPPHKSLQAFLFAISILFAPRSVSDLSSHGVCVWKLPNDKRLSLIVPFRGLCLEENRLPHAPQFASRKDTHTPCSPLDAHTFGTYASLVATLGLRKTRMMDVLPCRFGSSHVEISETDRR